MKPKDWFRHFSFLFILLFSFFSSDSSCEEQDIWLHGYKIPSSDPTLGQQYNRHRVRRPLGKMKPKDWFRQFLFYFRTQVTRNKTSGYMVTKYPPVTPLRANSTTVRRPLDKMKPKDWLRQFFPFLFYFQTQVVRNKTSGYHGYKEPSSGPPLNQ